MEQQIPGLASSWMVEKGVVYCLQSLPGVQVNWFSRAVFL